MSVRIGGIRVGVAFVNTPDLTAYFVLSLDVKLAGRVDPCRSTYADINEIAKINSKLPRRILDTLVYLADYAHCINLLRM